MMYLHLIAALASLIAVATSAPGDPICADTQMQLCPHKKFCCPTSTGAICGGDRCIFESLAPPPKDKCPIRGEKWCVEGTHCCPDIVQCALQSDGTRFCDMERTSAIVIPGSGDYDNSTLSILPISASTTVLGTLNPTGTISPNSTTTGGNPTTTAGGDGGSGVAKTEAVGGMAAFLVGLAVFVGL